MDNNKINFDNYIAKTYKIDDVTYFGRSVLEHCVIVGEVCKAFFVLLAISTITSKYLNSKEDDEEEDEDEKEEEEVEKENRENNK